MRRDRSGELRVAPVRRRLLAGLINATTLLVPIGVASAGGYTVYERVRRPGGGDGGSHRSVGDENAGTPNQAFELPRGLSRLLAGAGPVFAIQSRNWRGPGDRLMQIRRVDRKTSGPVTVRSALIQYAVTEVWNGVTGELLRPVERRTFERGQELDRHVREIKRSGDDLQARRQAIMKLLYRESDVNPLRSCGWRVAGALALQIPMLWSPSKQSVPERIAGVIVVET